MLRVMSLPEPMLVMKPPLKVRFPVVPVLEMVSLLLTVTAPLKIGAPIVEALPEMVSVLLLLPSFTVIGCA